MTSVLIVEDNKKKAENVQKHVLQVVGDGAEIEVVSHLLEATRLINTKRYDVIILDLMLPRTGVTDASDVSDEIIPTVQRSALNRKAQVIALSEYPDAVDNRRTQFADAGIIVLFYDEGSETWRVALEALLQRIDVKIRVDFLIFCALKKERSAFQKTNMVVGDLVKISGLDCLRVSLGTKKGLCILLPRMGIVDAAVIAARAIETFRPKIVYMSGICAGFSEKTKLGQLIVVDTCWEHQAGKWSGPDFKLEEYQIQIDSDIRTYLSQESERTRDFSNLKDGLFVDDAVLNAGVSIAPLVSGSAVIASEKMQELIADQHKRLVGLDMEMYGVYRAAQLTGGETKFVGVKTVVDFADEKKNDSYHDYGCLLSARVLVHLIPSLS